jgi:hypothetical protein
VFLTASTVVSVVHHYPQHYDMLPLLFSTLQAYLDQNVPNQLCIMECGVFWAISALISANVSADLLLAAFELLVCALNGKNEPVGREKNLSNHCRDIFPQSDLESLLQRYSTEISPQFQSICELIGVLCSILHLKAVSLNPYGTLSVEIVDPTSQLQRLWFIPPKSLSVHQTIISKKWPLRVKGYIFNLK